MTTRDNTEPCGPFQLDPREGLFVFVAVALALGCGEPTDEFPVRGRPGFPLMSDANTCLGASHKARLGWSLAVADFNGDGLSDVAAGAPYHDGKRGLVCIFIGAADGTLPLAGLLDQTCCGETQETGDQFGFSLAAGDFDADGNMDLAIGTPFEDLGFNDNGVVFAVPGTGTGALFGPGTVIVAPTGDVPADTIPHDKQYMGWSLAAGDFVGPAGSTYLAVGAPGRDVDGVNRAGAVFIYEGTPSIGLQPLLGRLVESHFLASVEAKDEFGRALAIGDLDGDGFDDLLIGVPLEDIFTKDGNMRDAGAVFWTLAGVTPFGTIPLARTLDPAFPTFRNGFIVQEDPCVIDAKDHFGWSVAASDLNADGFADVLAGAPFDDFEANDVGLVCGRFSTASGPFGGAILIVQKSDNELGFNERKDEFGRALASGDFNADGFGDIAISSPNDSIIEDKSPGLVFMRFGTDCLPSSIDLTLEYLLEEEPVATAEDKDRIGFNAMSAGDTNGDAVPDLIIGAPFKNLAEDKRGAVFLASTDATELDCTVGSWQGRYEGTLTFVNVTDPSDTTSADVILDLEDCSGSIDGRVYLLQDIDTRSLVVTAGSCGPIFVPEDRRVLVETDDLECGFGRIDGTVDPADPDVASGSFKGLPFDATRDPTTGDIEAKVSLQSIICVEGTGTFVRVEPNPFFPCCATPDLPPICAELAAEPWSEGTPLPSPGGGGDLGGPDRHAASILCP